MSKDVTVVLGASPNPIRFSHKGVKSLVRHNRKVIPVGFREGLIEDQEIRVGKPKLEGIHTVSLYIGSSRQTDFYDYIISLEPKRVIFNPGTVNPDFMGKLNHLGIEPVDACMLVMLSEETY